MTATSMLTNASEVPHDERKRRTAELLDRAQVTEEPERDALLEEVILLNIPVARSLAARYRDRGQPQDELEQVACLALTRAVHDFRPDRGDDLLVFAVPCILGELRRYFRDTTWAVRPPRRVQELRPRVFAAEEMLAQRLGRSPTAAELADDLACEVEDVLEAYDCGDCASPDSLDSPLPGDSTMVTGDRVADPEDGYARSEAIAMLGPACRKLKPRDRKILHMRFYKQLRQKQIAEELGVTQVQVSRLLQRILRDLRRSIEPEEPPVSAA